MNFAPSSLKTTSPGHGHILHQDAGTSQRTNIHQYDTEGRDVVGVLNDIKPQHSTSIFVTINFKTSEEMQAGQWIVLSVVLSARDIFGLPPKKFYGRDIAIGNDRPARDVAWQAVTVPFYGFPTQAQFLQLYIVRRAWQPGGDFGSVLATQSLYVCSTVLTYGGHSDAPSSFTGGYGFNYGNKYGEQL